MMAWVSVIDDGIFSELECVEVKAVFAFFSKTKNGSAPNFFRVKEKTLVHYNVH